MRRHWWVEFSWPFQQPTCAPDSPGNRVLPPRGIRTPTQQPEDNKDVTVTVDQPGKPDLDVDAARDAAPGEKVSHQIPSIVKFGFDGLTGQDNTGYSGRVRIGGHGVLCEPIQILNDPLGVYDVVWPGAHPKGPDYLGIPFQEAEIVFLGTVTAATEALFWANPYPLRMRIRTSAGLLCYEIDLPSELDDADRVYWLGVVVIRETLCL